MVERREFVGSVRKFIPLSALYDIVKDQYRAMIAGFKDEDVLVFGFLMVENLVDFESHGLARPHVGDLAEPAIYEVLISAGSKWGSM